LPAVLLINGPDYWQNLKPIYQNLSQEVSLNIKKSLASSLLEVAKIHFDEQFLTQTLV
jgi:hypothetical protein